MAKVMDTVKNMRQIAAKAAKYREDWNKGTAFAAANAGKASMRLLRFARILTGEEVRREMDNEDRYGWVVSPVLEALAWAHGGAFRLWPDGRIEGLGTALPNVLQSEYFREDGCPQTYVARRGCWQDDSGAEASEDMKGLILCL
jgi:hypothetical protein